MQQHGAAVTDAVETTKDGNEQWGLISEMRGPNCANFVEHIGQSPMRDIFVLYFSHVAWKANDSKVTGFKKWGQISDFLIPCKTGQR